VWLSFYVAPYPRVLKCVGQVVIDKSMVMIGERNGKVIDDLADS
jgi:hypothetical protein